MSVLYPQPSLFRPCPASFDLTYITHSGMPSGITYQHAVSPSATATQPQLGAPQLHQPQLVTYPQQASVWPEQPLQYQGYPPQPQGSVRQHQEYPVNVNVPAPVQQTSFAAPLQFMNAAPLAVVGPGAAVVDCPACTRRGVTKTSFVAGNTTQYV